MWCYGISHLIENNALMSNTPVHLAKTLTGLTGEALAEQMGISAPHLSRLKTGRVPTTTDHIKKLATICGVTEQEFYSLLAGDEAVADNSSISVVGTTADEPLLFDGTLMNDALFSAREIDQKYTNGRSKSEHFNKLLYAIYEFLNSEAK